MKKLIYLLIFILCVSCYAQEIKQGPVPEEFLQYNGIILNGNLNIYNLNDVIPLSFIPNNKFEHTKYILPSSFDLRDEDCIMSVRDQNPYGTCWAFSTCASLESTAMKKYGLDFISISPLNIVNKNPYNWVDLNYGGNYQSSSAYLMHLLGPVFESDNPYKFDYTSPLLKYNPIGYCEKTILIEDDNYGLSNDEILAIKEALYENGAVQLNYKHISSYYNSSNYSYYANSNLSSGGHAVTIIGWDDDYSKDNFKYTPEGNGAFLLKNSWGTSWGNKGYFWISYYDKGINNCCQYQLTDIKDVKYNKLYSYNNTSIYNSLNCRYGMMEYLAEDNGSIKGLQLCSINGGIKYNAKIYINDVLKGTKSHTFEYAGYENILLDSDIHISKGDVIKVYFDFNANNDEDFEYVYPYERSLFEYTPIVYKEPYCSYYSEDGKNYTSMGTYGNLACGVLVDVDENIIPVTNIKINKTSLSIDKGNSVKLAYTVYPTNASVKTVIWKSSNTSVAKVDNNGKITAVAQGNVYITATTVGKDKNGKQLSVSCNVEVTEQVYATSVILDKTNVSLEKGKSVILKATVLPNNISEKGVTWAIGNRNVATIDTNGKVTAISPGTTYVTVYSKAKNKDGNRLSCQCKVTVLRPVESVSINKTNINLKIGASQTLKATVLPTNAYNRDVIWKIGNTKVATIDENGNVKAVAQGYTYVTVYSKGTNKEGKRVSSQCKVTVLPNYVVSVSLNKTNINLKIGASQTLKATVLPTNAYNRDVTWKIGNTKVATIDTNGKVEAVGAGYTYVTVYTKGTNKDGKKLSAQCKINVLENYVESVSLNKTSLSLNVGSNETLIATVLPANATNKGVTWKSSNSNVATVDENGKVCAIEAGTCNITVTTKGKNKSGNQLSKICKVTVVNVPVTSVKCSDIVLCVGERKQLSVTVLPENATDKTVTWKSSNNKVATVTSSGLATGMSVGTTSFTITSNGRNKDGKQLTCMCKVTVVKNYDVTISITAPTVKYNDAYKLKYSSSNHLISVSLVLPSVLKSSNLNFVWHKDSVNGTIIKGSDDVSNNAELIYRPKDTSVIPADVTSGTNRKYNRGFKINSDLVNHYVYLVINTSDGTNLGSVKFYVDEPTTPPTP